jgi:multidrug resistance efflux pump
MPLSASPASSHRASPTLGGMHSPAPPDFNDEQTEKKAEMSKDLQTSKLAWPKLRRLLLTAATLGGVAATAWYAVSGDSVMLSADAIVTRQRVAVAAPWQDARVREIHVRPGDRVEAGQKIAIVESATISRSLAELAAEKARIGGRVAQLEGRKTVITTLLPLAESSAVEAQAFLNKVQNAGANGLAVSKTLVDLTAGSVQASERSLSLKAEQGSLEIEMKANKAALDMVSAAYDDLQQTYGNGILYAPVSGYIGAHVAMAGEVLSGGNDRIANIYTGPSFVLAYIPESYLFDVEEGQKVSVKTRGQTIVGDVEKVLPVTEALPPEFQLPNRARGRGQLVRIALLDKVEFPIDQKAHVSGCMFDSCKRGVSGAVGAATPALRSVADAAGRMVGRLRDFAVAPAQGAIATSASMPANVRKGISPTPR